MSGIGFEGGHERLVRWLLDHGIQIETARTHAIRTRRLSGSAEAYVQVVEPAWRQGATELASTKRPTQLWVAAFGATSWRNQSSIEAPRKRRDRHLRDAVSIAEKPGRYQAAKSTGGRLSRTRPLGWLGKGLLKTCTQVERAVGLCGVQDSKPVSDAAARRR